MTRNWNYFLKSAQKRYWMPRSPRQGDLTPGLRYPDGPMASPVIERDSPKAAAAPARAPAELIDAKRHRRRPRKARQDQARQRRRIARGAGAAAQGRADRGPRQGRTAAAQGSPRPPLRRAAVPDGRRNHPHPLRLRAQASLSVGEPVRDRAHGRGRDRRLWPRAAGAGLRHRSAVSAALQADRLGRVRSPKPSSIACGTPG